MSSRKYKCLTIAKKKKLIEKVEEGEEKSDVAKEFEIPQSTLSTIIKHAAQTAVVQKKTTEGEYLHLEEILVIWLRGQKYFICDIFRLP
ncbi:hypothetical protein WA026_017153 [Henosepilachna vigintioctopunctata]|uniref:HTH psq-type domain-containing protein n=1 Tax=Henosepilachna vigintioctopunctata TaxID=420089 RepID=A0AAW1TYZ1_9CUCU